ncbi:MAG: hypothetical protein AB7K52_02570 [Phycisphaerales bacterium]
MGVIAAAMVSAPAIGQNGEGKPGAGAGGGAGAALEAYLDRPGLRSLLAEHLAARLKAASAEERAAIGERLGKLYVEFIAASKTTAEREEWEARARELLKLVPDVQSYELKLDLARTVYAKAEAAAERHRLRLGTVEEAAEAERTLRQLKQQFEAVGAESSRKVEALERAEESGRGSEQISNEIQDARRVRSIAYYYAGWSAYYLSFLSGSEQAAADAIRNFGPLLGSLPGRSATLDRLPRSLLKYDHIARATIGCGLAQALRRNGDIEGLRWLDAVESESAISAEVRAQLFTRRLTILGGAGRWADIESLVRQARGGDHTSRPETIRPLEAGAARLLAVICFEADRRHNGQTIELLGQAALADLVARGDVAQVLDLAQRYGTTPLGDTGFIVHYVRGMQALERAVTQQKDAGEDPEAPSTSEAIINQYRQAAALLEGAVIQLDSGKFPVERTRALIAAGRAVFRAGDMNGAADRFSRAASEASDAALAEEALWLAIVSLDRAAREPGGSASQTRRDELVVLFVKTYPATERAANLLIRRDAASTGVDDEQAIGVLLGVAPDSPLYVSARRQAARVLYYRVFRRAGEAGRASAATRFMKIAEEVLGAEKRLAIESEKAEALEATERVIQLTRQMLDAILSLPAPDVARAEQALDTLRTVVAHNGVDLSKHEPEFKFRRFQIMLAREDEAGAEALADALRASGDRLADAADRMLYQRAVMRWRRAGGGERPEGAAADPWLKTHAASVVKLGSRLIDTMGAGPGALRDPGVQTVYRQVAQAAADLWETEKIESARDLAIRLDRALLDAAKARNDPPPVDALTRVAMLAEPAGDAAMALESWRVLASGLRGGSMEWFRAKYHTARLLSASDAAKALELLTQVRVLYPELGPEPWRTRLRELLSRLEREAPVPAAEPGEPSGAASGSAR